MDERKPVLIAIGSNVEPAQYLPEATRALERHTAIDLKALSRTYVTAPVGGAEDQPAFHNAAALVETELDPEALRATLRGIEAALGRERTADSHAPRTIDLDIAYYDRRPISLEGREIPDDATFAQQHLVVPLADVAPDWEHPRSGETLAAAAAAASSSDAPLVIAPQGRSFSYTTEGRYAIELEAAPGEVYAPRFESLVQNMLVEVGEDTSREGLERTPLRVAKAMDFLTSGYCRSLEDVVNNAIFEEAWEEMVVVKDIEMYSLCEHHLLPFFGQAAVGYLPNGRIIGLSKIARIVDLFARRLQVQERLTNQVADAMMEVLDPHGVAVVMEASHFCMMMRGVQKQNSSMVTSAMRGTFRTDVRTRTEFLELIRE